MGYKKIIGLSLCLAILSLTGCSGSHGPRVRYRYRMITGTSIGGIWSGKWVRTKTVNGVLMQRKYYHGFQCGPIFTGHTKVVNYP